MDDLHVKYRPTSLNEVIGQGEVVKSLSGVLKKRRTRAFVFTGPSGTGKTTLSRIIAKEVGATGPNLIEVDAATHTGVDDMRLLTDGLQYASINGGARMLIVDEAHALSKAAWQSLLKSVEEPPPGVFWSFCTTEASKIPNTILTRCAVYNLRPVGLDDLCELIQRVAEKEGIKISEELAMFIAESSDGSPRACLTNLSKCAGVKGPKEAAKLLASATREPEVIDLCRALASGTTDWGKLMAILKPLSAMNPESIRIVVCSYFQQIALNAKSDKKAIPALEVLQAFGTPYPPHITGIYPVLLSLGELLFSE